MHFENLYIITVWFLCQSSTIEKIFFNEFLLLTCIPTCPYDFIEKITSQTLREKQEFLLDERSWGCPVITLWTFPWHLVTDLIDSSLVSKILMLKWLH